MKTLRLFSLCAALMLALSVQAQMTQLVIRLDGNLLQNPDCWLNQANVMGNKVYFHSGLCTSNQITCDSIGPSNTPIFQHVVGNWAMDDGIGLMNYVGNGVWDITMLLESYYSSNISSGSTPMLPGATAYTIGLVFRDLDGMNEGKDDQCKDIFITDLNTNNPVVKSGATGQVFTPVTVTKTIVGVEEPDVFGYFRVGPNPFQGALKVQYYLRDDADAFSAKVYNTLGQEVVTLTEGTGVAGAHEIRWEGNNNAGQLVNNGVYYIVMTDGNRRLASEKVLLMR